MSAKHGGPAFPTKHFDNLVRDTPEGHYGMSLRDWFAGQVLAALIKPKFYNPAARATEAYEHADAMLAEREKEHTA